VRRTHIIATLAWRNLWRNHRRTLIMLTAISVGAWSMIAMTAFMRGMVDDMVLGGVRALPGHVQVHHPEFRDDPSISNLIEAPGGRLSERLSKADVVAWASRVRVPAVVSSERDTRGVILVGIQPERETGISFVADDISEGRFLESEDDRGVVVGRKLLERLETRLGKRIVIMSQDPDNQIAERGFRIVGVFDAKLTAHEETFLFAGIGTVQKMLKIGQQVSEIAVLGADYRDVDGLSHDLEQAAGPDLDVQPWYVLDKYLGSTLTVFDGFVWVYIVIIFLALSFGLVNTLVMAVFERVREIGLMLALGMRPTSILAQVICESLLLLALGLAVGNVVAWVTITALAGGIDVSIVGDALQDIGAGNMLYPVLNLSDVILANLIVLVLGFLASLSPAWRASRYHPVEAITRAGL